MHRPIRLISIFCSLGMGLLLVACASLEDTAVDKKADQDAPVQWVSDSAWAVAPIAPQNQAYSSAVKKPHWRHYELPGKRASKYAFARVDGRDAMAVTAASSASLLRQNVHIASEELAQIKFSWKVPELIAMADLAVRDLADSPASVVLVFEGDRGRFSAKNAMLSELAQVVSGEPLPYATLMYVWCNTRAPGSVIISPRTDRIRKMVVESGAKNLNMWMDYERNIRADFEKAFGEPPGALLGVGIMTDSDNTRTTTRAWYGHVSLANK
jgi:hypothetical protein